MCVCVCVCVINCSAFKNTAKEIVLFLHGKVLSCDLKWSLNVRAQFLPKEENIPFCYFKYSTHH